MVMALFRFRNWGNFYHLVWKNYRQLTHSKRTLFASIFFPVLFAVVLVSMRFSVKQAQAGKINIFKAINYESSWRALIEECNKRRATMKKEKSTFKNNVFVPDILVGYAPNGTLGLRNLVSRALGKLSIGEEQLKSFENCDNLRRQAYSDNYLANICFHETDESLHGLPKKLSFSILMPSEFRFYKDTWAGDSWKTDLLFDSRQHTISNDGDDGGVTGYVREGFISIQYHISNEYLQMVSGGAKLPKVQLRRFDVVEGNEKLFIEGVEIAIVLILLLGFMFPIVLLTKTIVGEREMGQFNLLDSNNVGNRLQFGAWYFTGFCLFFIISVIITLVLKISWNGYSGTFSKAYWFILMLFFMSYGLAITSFSILLAVLMNSTSTVFGILPLYWILLALPFVTVISPSSWIAYRFFTVATILLCNVTVSQGVRKMIRLEEYPQDMSMFQYLFSSIMDTEQTYIMLLICFYVQAVFYMITALFLDGSLCPFLLRLVKLGPLNLTIQQTRRSIKRRRIRALRKQMEIEHEKELRAEASRRLSLESDRLERLTRKTILYSDNESIVVNFNKVPKSDGLEEDETEVELQRYQKQNGDNLAKSADDSDVPSIGERSIKVATVSEEDRENIKRQIILEAKLQEKSEVKRKKERGLQIETEIEQLLQDPEREREWASFQKVRYETNLDYSSSEEEDLELLSGRHIMIEFDNVWKKFMKAYVVKKLSLKVFEGDLSVLLGHNASGKTTIINMLCGQVKPDHGKIYIDGIDVFKNPLKAFKNVGMALHNTDLIGAFKVVEQLRFICKLRGLNRSQTREDVSYFLRITNMEKIAQLRVENLSSGQTRILQILCAFVGHTKVVLLDKPLECVDFINSQLIYDLILREKRNRTILITSNFPKVASNLADRIGILVDGVLLYYKKPQNVYTKYKDGFRLICIINELCDISELFEHFMSFAPSIELQSILFNTVVFFIDYDNIDELIKLIDDLEIQNVALYVESYSLVESSLEYILMNALDKSKSRRTMTLDHDLPTVSYHLRQVEEAQLLIHKKQRLGGMRLILSHIYIVLRKRYILDIRYYTFPLIQLFLPSFMAAWTLFMPHLRSSRNKLLPNFVFDLDNYLASTALIKNTAKLDSLLAGVEYYKKIHSGIFSSHKFIEVDDDKDIMKYMRNYITQHNDLTDVAFVTAAAYADNEVEALFNNNLLHAAPLSLALVMDSLAVGFVGEESGISVTMEPLPYSTLHSSQLGRGSNHRELSFIYMLAFGFFIDWTISLLNLNMGRRNRFGRIELIAGMGSSTLAVATILYGIIKIVVSLIPLTAVFIIFNNQDLMSTKQHLTFNYIVIVVALCVLSINSLLSSILEDTRKAYIFILSTYCLGIVLFAAYAEFYGVSKIDEINFFLDPDIIPSFSLTHNLYNIFKFNERDGICNDKQTQDISFYLEKCESEPNCCDKLEWDLWNSLWETYVIMIIVWIFLYLRLSEKIVWHKKKPSNDKFDSDPDSQHDNYVLHFTELNDLDKSWIFEKIRVRTLESGRVTYKALHVENMGVFIGSRVILNRINFMVERYQCVALLGDNASGKTVLIKALLGTYPLSTGTVTTYKESVYPNMDKIDYKNIGYCAQEHDITYGLNVFEVIETVLVIRGLKSKNIKTHAQAICKIFDLYNYRYHPLTTCSRGVLKRLGLAIAMVGYASLILLDDPFGYLDVKAQSIIYNLMQSVCSRGQAIFFTAADPNGCEQAHRVAILKDTGLAAIGERHLLMQTHYSDYWVVRVKIDINYLINIENEWDDLSKLSREDILLHEFSMVSEYIIEIFTEAIVKSLRNHAVKFWLPRNMYSMSYILQTLKSIEEFYSFSIKSFTLSELYIDISKHKSRELIAFTKENQN